MTETGEVVATTATLEGARTHARAQAGAEDRTRANAATNVPDGVAAADVVWDETVGPGGYASRWLARDTIVRITDVHGDGSPTLVVFNALRPVERLNVADTVKVQWQAYLGPGGLLLSDMGRVLMTMVTDTSGRHDALCGASNRRANEQRYGDGAVHSTTPSARELLTVAAAKHGLEQRDLPPSINLFKGARVGDGGELRYEGDATPPTHVELRAEMDVLLLLANAPHPLDERPIYTATTVRCTAWRSARAADDPFRSSTPERQRAFENTEDFLLERAR